MAATVQESLWLLGDNILLPKPGFPLYQVICEVHRIECRFYDLLVSSVNTN